LSSDPNDLLHLLETCGPQLYALLVRLTLRADVAEDLLQELFLKMRDSAGLSKAQHARSYVFRAAIHLAFDWRRARRPIETLSHEPAAAEQSAFDALSDQEELEQVVDAMQSLSETVRRCLVMHYVQHEEYTEIARQLGKTEHQVRALCHKGVRQLRGILSPTACLPRKSKDDEVR
jgi:RNA polymerase sigma-70 factor (ECF subfamily)